MSKPKTLTAADLALYLGCQVWDSYNNRVGILQETRIPDEVAVTNKDGHARFILSVDEVKPILRRLESMTKEEGIESGKTMRLEKASAAHILMVKVWTAETFQYLLSKHFDLFGWIDSGLAIDAATIKG